MQDVEVTCVPSVKDTVSALSASLIQQLTAQYEALKQQLIVFYNSMICTSNDAVLDNIIVSINNILDILLKLYSHRAFLILFFTSATTFLIYNTELIIKYDQNIIFI